MDNVPVPENYHGLRKILLPILFVLLPAAGFFAGKEYQRITDLNSAKNIAVERIIVTNPPPRPSLMPAVIMEQNTSADIVLASDSSRFVEFASSRLGYSFSYPAEWGIPTEKIEDAKGIMAGEAGKIYSLTFPKMEWVYASGRSTDFMAPRGAMREDFRGNPDEKPGVKPYIDIEDPGCFTMGSHNSFFGNVDFNLPGKEIPGVRLFVPIITDPDREKLMGKYGVLGDDNYDCDPGSETAEKYLLIGSKILEDINSGEGIGDISKLNRDVFQKISASAKITD